MVKANPNSLLKQSSQGLNSLLNTEIRDAVSNKQLFFPEEKKLGVANLVHNRFILIHKTGITLWPQSKTSTEIYWQICCRCVF